MKYDGSISDYFPVNTGLRCAHGWVFAPTLFNTGIDNVLGRLSENSGCRVSFGTVLITDREFADDAVVFS